MLMIVEIKKDRECCVEKAATVDDVLTFLQPGINQLSCQTQFSWDFG